MCLSILVFLVFFGILNILSFLGILGILGQAGLRFGIGTFPKLNPARLAGLSFRFNRRLFVSSCPCVWVCARVEMSFSDPSEKRNTVIVIIAVIL